MIYYLNDSDGVKFFNQIAKFVVVITVLFFYKNLSKGSYGGVIFLRIGCGISVFVVFFIRYLFFVGEQEYKENYLKERN